MERLLQPALGDVLRHLMQVGQSHYREVGRIEHPAHFLKGERHVVRMKMLDVVGRVHRVDRLVGHDTHVRGAGDEIWMHVRVDVQPNFLPFRTLEHQRQLAAASDPQPTCRTANRSSWPEGRDGAALAISGVRSGAG